MKLEVDNIKALTDVEQNLKSLLKDYRDVKKVSSTTQSKINETSQDIIRSLRDIKKALSMSDISKVAYMRILKDAAAIYSMEREIAGEINSDLDKKVVRSADKLYSLKSPLSQMISPLAGPALGPLMAFKELAGMVPTGTIKKMFGGGRDKKKHMTDSSRRSLSILEDMASEASKSQEETGMQYGKFGNNSYKSQVTSEAVAEGLFLFFNTTAYKAAWTHELLEKFENMSGGGGKGGSSGGGFLSKILGLAGIGLAGWIGEKAIGKSLFGTDSPVAGGLGAAAALLIASALGVDMAGITGTVTLGAVLAVWMGKKIKEQFGGEWSFDNVKKIIETTFTDLSKSFQEHVKGKSVSGILKDIAKSMITESFSIVKDIVTDKLKKMFSFTIPEEASTGKDVVKAFSKGAVIGGVLGYFLGGLPGAALGASIGAAAYGGLAAGEVLTNKNEPPKALSNVLLNSGNVKDISNAMSFIENDISQSSLRNTQEKRNAAREKALKKYSPEIVEEALRARDWLNTTMAPGASMTSPTIVNNGKDTLMTDERTASLVDKVLNYREEEKKLNEAVLTGLEELKNATKEQTEVIKKTGTGSGASSMPIPSSQSNVRNYDTLLNRLVITGSAYVTA